MKPMIIALIGMLFALYSCQEVQEEDNVKDRQSSKEISFYTSDSIKIFGDLYELDKEKPILLLFHQGGSNARGEYGSIIPRLIEKGFNILAIDQRVGGQIYGNYNRTLANIPSYSFGDSYGYCDAYNNLESALDFVIASGFSGKKILWGSSYSAALAIQLAHQNQEKVSGVLAFSPASGQPMQNCQSSIYFETLKTPLLILRPPNEMENENVIAQFELADQYNHQTYAAKYGVHGSSMLVEERVNHKVEENWKIVLAFLDNF